MLNFTSSQALQAYIEGVKKAESEKIKKTASNSSMEDKIIDDLPKANPSQMVISKKQFATTLAITGALAGAIAYCVGGKAPKAALKKLEKVVQETAQKLSKADIETEKFKKLYQDEQKLSEKLKNQLNQVPSFDKAAQDKVSARVSEYRKALEGVETIYESAVAPDAEAIQMTTARKLFPFASSKFVTEPKERNSFVRDLVTKFRTEGKIEIPLKGKLAPQEALQEAMIDEDSMQHIGKVVARDMTVNYGTSANWSNPKIARDILQNFYDANGHSLDGVGFLVEKLPTGKYRIKISGNGVYNHKKLYKLGETTKKDAYDAGGFGEGAKIVCASLLSKGHAENVRFASADWGFVYGSKGDDLVTVLHKTPEVLNGNYVEFETANESFAIQMIRAMDYFRHSANPDFHKLTFENDSFGFRILEPGQKGNFYLTQRFEFNKDGTWSDGVDGLDIIFKRKPDLTLYEEITGHKFATGRDRNKMFPQDVFELTRCFAKEMSDEELIDSILSTQKHWSSLTDRDADTAIKSFIAALNKEASERSIGLDFGDKKICQIGYGCTDTVLDAVVNAGYEVIYTSGCDFAALGVPRATNVFKALSNHRKLPPTPQEAKKMKILEKALGVIQKSFEESYATKVKEIVGKISPDDLKKRGLRSDSSAILATFDDFSVDKSIAEKYKFCEGDMKYLVTDKSKMADAICEFLNKKIAGIDGANIHEEENQKVIRFLIALLEDNKYENEPFKQAIIQLRNLEIINRDDVVAPRFVFDRTKELSKSTLGEAIIKNNEYKGHWVDRTYLNKGNFFDLLATWVHEICHKSGGDGTAEFTYKLTDILEALLTTTANSQEAQIELAALEKVFNEIK